ncbi:hypothetical protein Poli38472_014761 [Pythium oligandrum]|uniref:Uncharacterized protein n=1 Tax=Pythium oligandrum TaxID=41045 RepID=A0A8K1F993_PYTOL|nr:hypothetical protein Poli38472_014761 [Pythium oligandrum]|eukprot:TMW54990.1 hypothetical protein Poli38472_014761 [Pythium oligandrum]
MQMRAASLRAKWPWTRAAMLSLLWTSLLWLVVASNARLLLQLMLQSSHSSFSLRGASLMTRRCSPIRIDTTTLPTATKSRWTQELQSVRLPPSPVFQDDRHVLCDATNADQLAWGYCLPLGHLQTPTTCEKADRMGLLQGKRPVCRASVQHMLLVDVYDALETLAFSPALLSNATNATTDTSRVSYVESNATHHMTQTLRARGYHVFQDDDWRVCVAPTHPLAGLLYDPTKTIPVDSRSTPHIQLLQRTPSESQELLPLQLHGDTLLAMPSASSSSTSTL